MGTGYVLDRWVQEFPEMFRGEDLLRMLKRLPIVGSGAREGVYRTQARLGTCNRAAQEMLSTSHTCYF